MFVIIRATAIFNGLIFLSTPLAPAKGAKKTATPRKAAGESSVKAKDKNSERKAKKTPTDVKEKENPKRQDEGRDKGGKDKVPSKDDSFREFRRVCSNVADVDAYTDKTAIVRKMLTQGSQGGKYLVIPTMELTID